MIIFDLKIEEKSPQLEVFSFQFITLLWQIQKLICYKRVALFIYLFIDPLQGVCGGAQWPPHEKRNLGSERVNQIGQVTMPTSPRPDKNLLHGAYVPE